jgi:carboxylesterase
VRVTGKRSMKVLRDYSYFIRGGRVGILLIHGLGGTPHEMGYVANGLAKAGCTVSCPQLAGHCGTQEDMAATTWADWLMSAESAMLELRKACDGIVVGGLFTGAMLALLLAGRHPGDIQGSVLFAPALRLDGWMTPWYVRLLDRVRPGLLADFPSLSDAALHGVKGDRVREFIQGRRLDAATSIVGLPGALRPARAEQRALAQTVMRELGSIEQPALIVHAREDDGADLDNAAYLQRHLRGAVEMVVLDDCYHLVTIDRQRHIAVERATTFVASVTKRMRERTAKVAPTGMADAPQTITVEAVPA